MSKNTKGKIPKKMKKRLTRITTSVLVIVMTLAVLLSVVADAVGYSESAAYIKQLDSVYTNYESYLDGSVVQKLPSTVRDDDVISIIVMTNDPCLIETYDRDGGMTFAEYSASDAADGLRETVARDKAALTERLDGMGIEYTAGAEYVTVLTGYEISVQARYYDEIVGILGTSATAVLGEVYTSMDSEVVENAVDVYETGIFDSSDFGYTGEGMVVAVLDTGLDYTHDAFNAANMSGLKLGLTVNEVAAVLGGTNAASIAAGLLAGDVYVSDKVPFAFDYADGDSDVYSIHNNHGTHVSGVIAGEDDVITGVAPKAQIVSMKIFSDTYDSAKTTWILSALEDAVTLGVDVINMSIGTACGFSRETDDEIISGVYDRIREQGISLVVAASNSYSSAYGSEKNGNLGLTSNPDTGTVGSPSTYAGALSVASISGTKTPYILYGSTIIYFTEATDSANEEKKFFEELLGDGASAELEYVLIPGVGSYSDYADIDIAGKIALVRRGTNTFEEKANAAQKAGAKGIIVYNNTSGDIKMNAGITTIPICSISQDDGEMLAAAGRGTIKIAHSQAAGPFMSDFSSWGPTPDLKIKPEITAHGGNIYSSVTGNEYDILSGTSMACPNVAGLCALLRQYVLANYPAELITLDNGEFDYVEVNAVVYRLLMSTADIIYNKNGLPYAVRKQGAGLANLNSCALSTAYVLTYDEGVTEYTLENAMNTSKLELGDDPSKNGVYTMTFSVFNFGTTTLSYDISAIVMSEGVSETPTYKGDTVVTEEGYLLSGASLTVDKVSGGTLSDRTVTVNGGATATVTLTVTLSDTDKAYLDASFENGMYVEGFIKLDAVSGTDVDLSVPYLAFYGDWTKAPIFDLDYYDTNEDELDDSLETLEKTLADAYPTRPIGGVSGDYISYLGSYYFIQNPKDKIIAADRDYIAISNYDGTVHSLRFVWAGLLRNAERIVITITDDATGEVVFERTENDIRKSYGDGGSIYPANVEIEFDAAENNLKNNSTYTVKLQAYLDYGDGGLTTNEKNTFEFPLTVDFEAPTVTDVEYYTEYDKDAKKTRLFARVAVYDNHYAMSMQVGYISKAPEDSEYENMMNTFSNYMTPIYSEKNSTTYVTYELTDLLFDIKNEAVSKNTFTVSVYDYALNYGVYEIPLPDEYLDFYLEETSITLNPFEVYTVTPLVYPNTEWPELLNLRSSNEDVVRVVNNKLIAVESGKANVVVYDDAGNEVWLNVTVRAEGDEGYKELSQPVADVFEVLGYETLKAYYLVDSTAQDIGETGDIRSFDGSYNLSLYPSESVKLNIRLYEYFEDITEIMFVSGNEKVVTVDERGVITAVGEGNANVTVRLKMNGKNTSFSQPIRIEVKDPYVRSGPRLSNYYGLGGIVAIPSDLLFTEIGDYAFSNFEYIPKEEYEITEDEPDTTKVWYIGENTITKVIIPEGIEKIGAYSFAGLTALKEVVLPSTLKYIEYGAFYGCTSLEKVTGLENVVTINKYAFQDCNLKGEISLDSAHAIADYAFASNERLEKVVISKTLRSIGAYAFAQCEALQSVKINAEKVKLGMYAFAACEGLTEITVNASVIPAGAFYMCTGLTDISLGKDVEAIGEYAFTGTKARFTVDSGNTVFTVGGDGYALLTNKGKTLSLLSPAYSDSTFTMSGVTEIGSGAFAANGRLTAVVMPDAVRVGDYAFADCTSLTSVTLGALTEVGDYAFFYTALTSVPALSAELDEIGRYAFAYTELVEVNIPAGMTVGEGAFCECTSLSKVTVGDGAVLGFGAFMLGRDSYNERNDSYNWVLLDNYDANGSKYYFYSYKSALTSLTIGNGVVIGDSAFLGAAALSYVKLGSGAVIGDQAFYNAERLVDIDLSAAVSIGELAFSGDVLYMFSNSFATEYYVDSEGNYLYTYHAPVFVSVDLTGVGSIGESAFSFCRKLETVTLGESITRVPKNAFSSCIALKSINLDKVTSVGDYAFSESGIESADLSYATEIGEYAFVYCDRLSEISLADGVVIGEGAFAYCPALTVADNLGGVRVVGDYAFAYSALTELDLSGAVSIGNLAFMKENATEVTLTLGESLESLGDNPFAYCTFAQPFHVFVTEVWNGKEYTSVSYTYDISESVKVIDGSLYCVMPYGLELIAYNGTDSSNVILPEGVVRLSAYSLAASDVVRVTLPHSLNSIGHKAFYDCDKLVMVVFKSYEAPVLEEEFDQNYFFSGENFPDQSEYSAGGETFSGLGIVPYTMYITLDAMTNTFDYSTVYYGATFVDYVGHADPTLVMVAPSNGLYYDSFIFGQYFGMFIDGDVAADDTTLAAIDAINRIPSTVRLEDKPAVVAAREAYSRIVSTEQQALVYNYSVLLSAEQRIYLFEYEEPTDNGDADITPPEEKKDTAKAVLTVLVTVESVLILAVALLAAWYFLIYRKGKRLSELLPWRKRVTECDTESEKNTQSAEDAQSAESDTPDSAKEDDTNNE